MQKIPYWNELSEAAAIILAAILVRYLTELVIKHRSNPKQGESFDRRTDSSSLGKALS
jgi:hypothetical protein